MSALTAVVHEQVHEWASQQRQPQKRAKQMGAVFHPKVDARDRQEANQDHTGRRFRKLPDGDSSFPVGL
jgi:hypothetical protein